MIVGDYYINNYFLAFLGLVALGGLAVTAGVPGMLSPENPAGEKDYNLSIQGQGLNPGETAAIRMLKTGGDPVKNAEVFVNGRKTGQTNENGLATFQIPQAGNLTVSASKSGTNVTRTYRIESRSQDDGGEGEETPDEDEGNQEDEQNDQQDDQGSEDRDEQDQKQDDSQTDENETEKETGDNETVLDPYITKLRPSRDLEDPRFEPKFEIQASDASYNLSFNGKLEATGSVNGTKNISMPFRMPKNGTIGLEVQLYRGKKSLAYRNFTFNYTAEQDEEKTVSDPAEVEAMFTAPSTAFTGEEIVLNASESSGDIINYTWSIGEQAETTTTNHIHEHTFASTGEYRINLTVNGENDTSDNDSILIEVIEPEEPIIDFQQPLEGYETDQTSIQYEFEVDNVRKASQYTVMVDGKQTTTGSLDEGNNSIQKIVEIPEELFNTSIKVEIDGSTYSSENRTVNASQSSMTEPEFTLKSPGQGETFEILESPTTVSVKYEVIDRKWATKANLTLKKEGNKQLERPVSVISGTHTEELSDLPPANYTYKLELIDGERKASKKKEFEIRKVEPEYSVSQVEPVDGKSIDNHTINFTVNLDIDKTSKLLIQAFATEDGDLKDRNNDLLVQEGQKVIDHSMRFSGGRSTEYTYEGTVPEGEGLTYEWYAQINRDGEMMERAGNRTFTVTAPDDGGDGGAGT